MGSLKKYNSPVGTGVGGAPTLVLTGNLLSFQLSLAIGSQDVGHHQQFHLNIADRKKYRRDMLDDSINFVIYELKATGNILAKDLNQQKHHCT